MYEKRVPIHISCINKVNSRNRYLMFVWYLLRL